MNIVVNEDGDQEYGIGQSETTNADLFIDISQIDWFVYNDNFGTSEEKYLVKYIKQAYSSLKNKYDEIYLIRNEKHFKIFSFDEGLAFEPDFVLFLSKSKSHKNEIYQVFIEPKGGDRISNDDSKLKEKFLLQIENEYKLTTIFKNKDFKLIGLPLYNETISKTIFDKKVKDIMMQS